MAPIKSTVPAVRPVPTLISGAAKPMDSLLGPPGGSFNNLIGLNSTGGALLPTPTQLPLKSVTSRGQTQSSRSTIQSSKPFPDTATTEDTKDYGCYDEVLLDQSVNLVLSRLRRTQHHFDKLVTTNQADLQSFTFTQNR